MRQTRSIRYYLLVICFAASAIARAQPVRTVIPLNANWRSIASNDDKILPAAYQPSLDDNAWKKITVPHNWDAYEGYRRLLHGNRHGDAWYRRTISLRQNKTGKRFFLFFEGVGSYATVYLNGQWIGEHAGGRTTFTIDVTGVLKTDGSENLLAVRAWHPSQIKDLPWVCGGCSDERGFSEGSQPMGIFRPVSLVITDEIRVEPFGIHAWTTGLSPSTASLSVATTLKNYSARSSSVTVVHQLKDAADKTIKEINKSYEIKANDSVSFLQEMTVPTPHYWSDKDPYLYKIITQIKKGKRVIDEVVTSYGFRTINWKTGTHQFLLNGKPVFINGVAEYEHLLGQGHAFSEQQIRSRMKWLQAAGFNAFRDGHQPHNLLYGQLCNENGILWWTQLSAHVWYDSPAFRNNFKKLLREWVIERRNDPAVILWGLQNESKLPEDFAKECTELIRALDPTASSQRLVTTCNGGSGTDWDVPQNWTGTYGGDPGTYAADIKKQVLIGEYGAWRTIDMHTEGPFVQNGPLSEDRMTQLMEKKIRLGESAKDSSAGQFFWLLTSHDNPGRIQGGEGLRELDRIGPVNYKGLLTPWEEPLDAFYMYRANYASRYKEPMVYIVSHTWPGRWTTPGKKKGIVVYSNCEEVELFNDIDNRSLGKRAKKGIGTHFQWDDADIQYNVLYAVGYVSGKAVAKDTIVLHHLPQSPNFQRLYTTNNIARPAKGYQYIYRVNCGGPDYTDSYGNRWSADHALPADLGSNYWGSVSWTHEFPGTPDFFASQRRIFDPVKGTKDWPLFQTFRYGRDQLQYRFPVADGEYLVELFFAEPWLGIGGGMNAAGMRLFDVAINDKSVLKDIDLWKEAGTHTAIKKQVRVKITGGQLILNFPQTKAGEAVIAAIAIASAGDSVISAPSYSLVKTNNKNELLSWLDIGDKVYANKPARFQSLPPALFGADWIRSRQPDTAVQFAVNEEADVFVAMDTVRTKAQGYEYTQTVLTTDENGGTNYPVFRKRVEKGKTVDIPQAWNPALVAIVPVSAMQPAFDLKPVTAYRSNVAIVHPGVEKEMVNGRECTVVKTNEPATIEWPVQTGVADIYSITVKYFYPLEKTVQTKVQLIGPGGVLMQEETIDIGFTRPGKWNTVGFTTSSMINAGNYKVKLITKEGKQIAVSGIEIQ